MQIVPFKKLACPLDLEPLICTHNIYTCVHGHTYDRARLGYVNLLPAHFKHSRQPGDKKEMVAARTAFLNSGAYEGILQALVEAVKSHFSPAGACNLKRDDRINNPLHIIDAGCGEGYYTAGLAHKLKSFQLPWAFSLFGYDISKEAIQAAAKRDKDITWAVATNARIPVLSQQGDIILCLFGFPVFEEFARVLKTGGRIILIEAGPDHLIELRQKIYKTVFKKEKTSAHLCLGFKCVKNERHKILLKNITAVQIDNLLKMTPHYYRMQKDTYDALLHNAPDELTVDFYLTCYERLTDN